MERVERKGSRVCADYALWTLLFKSSSEGFLKTQLRELTTAESYEALTGKTNCEIDPYRFSENQGAG